MEGIFGMEVEEPRAAGSAQGVLALLCRENLVEHPPMLLGAPAERLAEERREEDVEDVGPGCPLRSGSIGEGGLCGTHLNLVDRVTLDAETHGRLGALEIAKELPHAARELVAVELGDLQERTK